MKNQILRLFKPGARFVLIFSFIFFISPTPPHANASLTTPSTQIDKFHSVLLFIMKDADQLGVFGIGIKKATILKDMIMTIQSGEITSEYFGKKSSKKLTPEAIDNLKGVASAYALHLVGMLPFSEVGYLSERAYKNISKMKLDESPMILSAPKKKKTMKKKLDDKFWRMMGHCFDCQVEYENKLRVKEIYDKSLIPLIYDCQSKLVKNSQSNSHLEFLGN